MKRLQPGLLKGDGEGGTFNMSVQWINMFCAAKGFTMQRKTTTSDSIPENWPELGRIMALRLAWMVMKKEKLAEHRAAVRAWKEQIAELQRATAAATGAPDAADDAQAAADGPADGPVVVELDDDEPEDDEPEDEDAREAGDLDEEDEFHDAMDGDE